MSWRGRLLVAFGLPVLSVLICLVVIEVVLQFMPVATGLGSMPVNATNPVFHYAPDRPYVFSHGWYMHRVRRGRSNNAGWINEQDYQRNDPTPLLAVVGNSFIEALMVPDEETMQSRLARSLTGKFRVYSFAASGAPLSQYLIWAGHAVREYGARAVVINVVGNDFDESVCLLKRAPGFSCFLPDAEGRMQLRLIDHQVGLVTNLVRMSALARYMLINLQSCRRSGPFPTSPNGSSVRRRAQPRYAGNTETGADEQRVRLSLELIDAFFRELPGSVGLRLPVYFHARRLSRRRCREGGRGQLFRSHAPGVRGEGAGAGVWSDRPRSPVHGPGACRPALRLPDDGHWSGNGHAVAGQSR